MAGFCVRGVEPSSSGTTVLDSILKSPHLLELEGSLPYSQHYATGPCPEPPESSTQCHVIFLRDSLTLLSHLRLSLSFTLFRFP
jgi:hypothetical protein